EDGRPHHREGNDTRPSKRNALSPQNKLPCPESSPWAPFFEPLASRFARAPDSLFLSAPFFAPAFFPLEPFFAPRPSAASVFARSALRTNNLSIRGAPLRNFAIAILPVLACAAGGRAPLSPCSQAACSARLRGP